MKSPSYQVATRLFLRSIGVIYLIAFLSAHSQITGLVGQNGILPVVKLVKFIKNTDALGFLRWPSLLYFSPTDRTLETLCLLGTISSAFIIVGLFQRFMLMINFLFYISLVYAGQIFFEYQWDSLLLESGAVAILLASGHISDRYQLAIVPNKAAFWSARLLLFKLMFQSGLVKILSHDPSWAGLTALQFHFMTQPLPHVFSWYASHLPGALLKIATAVTLVIEILLSWLILIPRRYGAWAQVAFTPLLLLQLLIMLTGNYGFFNLLTLCLCLLLLDDRFFHDILPKRIFWTLYVHPYAGDSIERKNLLSPIYLVFATLFLTFSLLIQMQVQLPKSYLEAYQAVQTYAGRWKILSNYGLFAVMTKTRREIIIETSQDGQKWEELQFPYKIGQIDVKPKWTFFHMPRLDWQLWFASLAPVERSTWFAQFTLKMLEGKKEVIRLTLFDERLAPPKYVRSYLYDYEYSNKNLKNSQGVWWIRTPVSPFSRPTSILD